MPKKVNKEFKRTLAKVDYAIAFKKINGQRKGTVSRTTKITDELIFDIAAGVSRGHTPTSSAKGAGISSSVFERAMKTGREDEERLNRLEELGQSVEDKDLSQQLKLVLSIRQAMFHSEDTALVALHKEGNAGNVHALTWFLERRFPKKYAKLSKIEQEVNAKTQTVIVVPETAKDDKEWERIRLENEEKTKLVEGSLLPQLQVVK